MNFEEYIKNLDERLSRVENKTEDLDCRIEILETRVDKIEGKLDTLLDSTSQIKVMLTENTAYSRSAKHNSLGWGFLSFISGIIFNALRILSALF